MSSSSESAPSECDEQQDEKPRPACSVDQQCPDVDFYPKSVRQISGFYQTCGFCFDQELEELPPDMTVVVGKNSEMKKAHRPKCGDSGGENGDS